MPDTDREFEYQYLKMKQKLLRMNFLDVIKFTTMIINENGMCLEWKRLRAFRVYAFSHELIVSKY